MNFIKKSLMLCFISCALANANTLLVSLKDSSLADAILYGHFADAIDLLKDGANLDEADYIGSVCYWREKEKFNNNFRELNKILAATNTNDLNSAELIGLFEEKDANCL